MFQKILALGIVIILSGVMIQGTDVTLSPVKATHEGFTGTQHCTYK